MRVLPLLPLLAVALPAAGGWDAAVVTTLPETPFDHVAALAWDGGTVWAGGFDGGLARLDDDGWRLVPIAGPPTASWINALCWHKETLWVGSNDGLGRWRPGFPEVVPVAGVGGAVHGLRVAEGRLIVAGADAVWIERGPSDPDSQGSPDEPRAPPEPASSWRHFDLSGESLHAALLLDGEVWTAGLRGILRREGERWRRSSELNGALPDSWVTALAPVGDEVWAGTYDAGLLAIDRRGRARVLRVGEWVNPNAIEVLAGGAAIGTQGDGLLIWDRPARRWRRLTTADGLPSDNVTAVLTVGDVVWVGTRRGIARIQR